MPDGFRIGRGLLDWQKNEANHVGNCLIGGGGSSWDMILFPLQINDGNQICCIAAIIRALIVTIVRLFSSVLTKNVYRMSKQAFTQHRYILSRFPPEAVALSSICKDARTYALQYFPFQFHDLPNARF